MLRRLLALLDLSYYSTIDTKAIFMLSRFAIMVMLNSVLVGLLGQVELEKHATKDRKAI